MKSDHTKRIEPKRASSPTITDVAKDAGVAIMTVSRVINGGSYVSEATEKRVRASIERLGYKPNEAARTLKGQRARLIGLIVPDLADSFFATCANAVQEVAGHLGYMTMIVASERRTDFEADEIEMMAARNIAGLILVPSRTDASQRLDEIRSHGVPIVTLDRVLAGLPAGEVTVENCGGAEEAVIHLIGHGHRRIACLGYDAQFSTIQERIQGYTTAMRAASLPTEIMPNLETAAAVSAALHGRLRAADRPTALFTLNNVTTIHVLTTLREMNLQVPDDVALIGFDDFELAPLLATPLTAVRQPPVEIGRRGAQLLFEAIREHATSGTLPGKIKIILPTELILRRSCGCGSV
jgi:LacI family transcriptional regulator